MASGIECIIGHPPSKCIFCGSLGPLTKEPDFWSADEEGEDQVIGDEPATPERIRSLQRKLCRKAKAELAFHTSRPTTVCRAMNPVGKPDAGNRHVRFDEREGKTERPSAPPRLSPALRAHPGYGLIVDGVLSRGDGVVIIVRSLEPFQRSPRAFF